MLQRLQKRKLANRVKLLKAKTEIPAKRPLFAFRGTQTQAMVACFYCVKQTEILPGEVSSQAGGEA